MVKLIDKLQTINMKIVIVLPTKSHFNDIIKEK